MKFFEHLLVLLSLQYGKELWAYAILHSSFVTFIFFLHEKFVIDRESYTLNSFKFVAGVNDGCAIMIVHVYE